MNPIKAFLIAGVITLAAGSVWPQHGKPGVQPGVPGGGGGGGLTPQTGVASVYDDATACWNFDDPTDMGLENCGPTAALDLTLVNTPTTTGGALGYAAAFDGVDQLASRADTSDLSGSADSQGWCLWFRRPTAQTGYLWEKGNTAGAREALMIQNTATNMLSYMYSDDDSENINVTTGGTGTRNFHCIWYDSADDKMHGSNNAGTVVNSAGTLDEIKDTTSGLYVGAYISAGWTNLNIGPMYRYKGSIPPVSDLYNSGKGLSCAATVAGGFDTNLVACWDMTEDGGPYADSIGSNTLTGVNTPTRAAGLVESSDSGMGVNMITASAQNLNVADPAGLSFSGDHSIVYWINGPLKAANYSVFAKEEGGDATREYAHWTTATNGYPAHILFDGGGFVICTSTTTVKDSVWHMVVTTYDSSDKKVRIYVDDGAATASAALTTGVLENGSTDFRIGDSKFNSHLSGNFDNVAAWSRLLTSDEIAGLWAAGAGDFYSAYWDAYFADDPIRFAWSQMPEIRRIP